MLSAFFVSPIFNDRSDWASITLTSSGVLANSATALVKTFLAYSNILSSHYTYTRFKNILALSSCPKGNENFDLFDGSDVLILEGSRTAGNLKACSSV
jgi:hypothetical protein